MRYNNNSWKELKNSLGNVWEGLCYFFSSNRYLIIIIYYKFLLPFFPFLLLLLPSFNNIYLHVFRLLESTVSLLDSWRISQLFLFSFVIDAIWWNPELEGRRTINFLCDLIFFFTEWWRKKNKTSHTLSEENKKNKTRKRREHLDPPPQTAEKLNLNEVCVWRRRDKTWGGKVEKDREKKMTLTQPTWNIFWRRKTQKLKINLKMFQARKHKKKKHHRLDDIWK